MNTNLEDYEISTAYTHSQCNESKFDDFDQFETPPQPELVQLTYKFRQYSQESSNYVDHSHQQLVGCYHKHHFATKQEHQKFVADYKRKQKTELCKTFQESGTCRYGDNCSFAHGEAQLKEKKHLHNKYRTKPCKKFFDNMYCNYGQRCQYMHQDILEHEEYLDYLAKLYEEKCILLTPIKDCSQFINKLLNEDEERVLKHPSGRLQIFEQLQVCNELRSSNFTNYNAIY